MTRDELHQAAKRLLECPPPDAVHQGIYADMDEMAEDAWVVAEAYLALAASDGPQWREIGSAPKDGTTLLLGFDYEGFLFTASRGYWTEHNGGGWVRHCGFQPTHWMLMPVRARPLPDQPKGGA
jgi:hypothetical protein